MFSSANDISVENNHIRYQEQQNYYNMDCQKPSTDISYTETSTIKYEDQIMQCNEDVETEKLRSLLKSWNQEILVDYFIAQNVFLNVLKVIKRHHIERLLRNFDMGTQILFEHNLEEWRRSIGVPLMDYCNATHNCTVTNLSSLSSSRPSCSFIRAPTPPTDELRFAPYASRSSSPDDSNTIKLASILNETPKGIMLIEYYNRFSKFHDDQRLLMINAIAQFFEERGLQMTLATSHRLEREILERFPSEKLEYYRTSKRGKIYNKFCNLKTSFKTAISNHVLPQTQKEVPQNRKSRYEKDFVPEDDAESYARSLKCDNLTKEQFENCWKACSRYRLNQIRTLGSIAAIMEQWPSYRTPSGFKLIDVDFKIAFQNGNGLLNKWEQCSNKILLFLSTDNHVKEKNIRVLLEKVKDNNLSENSRNAALFWALHGYFVPINKIIKKDVATGKKSITKFTIKDSQESFMFLGDCHQKIEDHILHLKNTKASIQPFVYCIGEDILSISEIYVYFEDTRFKFINFLRAVDICFKIFYLFDLNFPTASVMFYNFIETYCFELKSVHSFSKVHIMSETVNVSTDQ